ncbi:hypothetical protein PAEPH01_0337 [Pancytospora epiphaga]|nr:hypothetical protein PAEPH01_0337 [Pancytospora epiphaga]
MKAIQKSNNVIVIKRHPHNYKEVEGIVLGIRQMLQEFRSSCENRFMESFPYETIQKMVSSCEQLKNTVMDIEVDENYINTVIETRNVEKYFEDRFSELREAEKIWKMKREAFNKFHEMLLELKETHFTESSQD